MTIFKSGARFSNGEAVKVKGMPPGMSNHRGVIRLIFQPTPAGMWRYLLHHPAQQIGGVYTKPFVHAYDQNQLELE